MSSESYENKKTNILEAAYKIISQKGYANVTLREISKEANIALSQLNYYFVNKEGLFVDLFKFMSNKYIEKLDGYLIKTRSDVNIQSRINEFFIETFENDPGVFKILFDIVSMALWSDKLKGLIDTLFVDMTSVINKHMYNTDISDSSGQVTISSAKFMLSSELGVILLSIFSSDSKYQFDILPQLPPSNY
ncbi:MAG: TetR/AcrR family transcriptional regulator [Firmicutes bacterium]|nr:TetR/AcrR family transcriptional regulator [Bacillota bacterium]